MLPKSPQMPPCSDTKCNELGNILWLVPLFARRRCLLLRGPEAPAFQAVAAMFEEVVEVVAQSGSARSLTSLLADLDGEFDCVLVASDVPDTSEKWSPATARALLQRVAARGAILMERRGRRWLGFKPGLHRFEAGFFSVGATEARLYYVSPHTDSPRDIVPLDTAAIIAWDALTRRPAHRQRIRNWLTRWGWHELLFDHAIIVVLK